MIKDPDKLLDDEMHWVRSGRVLNAGTSVPNGVRVCYLPGTWICSPPREFYKHHPFGIFMDASSCKLDHLLYPFPIPLPFKEHGG